jgi:hypothetical protein
LSLDISKRKGLELALTYHATNPRKYGTNAQSLDDIGSTSNARVEGDSELFADPSIDDVFEGIHTGNRTINLTAGVI